MSVIINIVNTIVVLHFFGETNHLTQYLLHRFHEKLKHDLGRRDIKQTQFLNPYLNQSNIKSKTKLFVTSITYQPLRIKLNTEEILFCSKLDTRKIQPKSYVLKAIFPLMVYFSARAL